jgi:hypothetical protein
MKIEECRTVNGEFLALVGVYNDHKKNVDNDNKQANNTTSVTAEPDPFPLELKTLKQTSTI